MEQFRVIEFEMKDGTTIRTVLFDELGRSGKEHYIDALFKQMCDEGDMIVGFDTDWSVNGTKVALLKLCTVAGCLLVRSTSAAELQSLNKFFHNKEVVFAGTKIKRDVELLQMQSSIGIRNVVDIGELAARAHQRPALTAYGVRGLASKVCPNLDIKPQPSAMPDYSDWSIKRPMIDQEMRDQVESATIDAYAAYRIAQYVVN